VFAVAVVGSGFALLYWLSDLTFWRDEWAFLLHRGGFSPDVFLEPHYEHIAVAPIVVYKGLLALFGMDSPTPFQVVAVATFLLTVALLFVYLRRRVSAWLALAGVLPILFFGSSWDDLLWPFQIGYFGSMAAGIGALLALDREDRAGDLWACALLVVALSFSSVGVPFAVAGAVHVLTGADVRRRAYVAAVPIALYALWWLGWGHEAENRASLDTLLASPAFVFDGFASNLSSLLGLAGTKAFETDSFAWGRPLLIGALALAGLRLWRLGRVPRWVLVTVALGLSFWLLAGLNTMIGREPDAGRYQYVGAIFTLLIAAELLRRTRIPRPAVIAALAISAVAALSNFSLLEEYGSGLAGLAAQQRGGLAALELARDRADPGFQLTMENSDVDYLGELDAGSYFSAVDGYGSPAYDPAQLVAASEPARIAADKVSAAALGITLEPASGGPPAGDCLLARPAGAAIEGDLPPGGALLAVPPRVYANVDLRRYATASFPVKLGRLRGATAALRIPPDRSSEPWQIGITATGPVRICEAPA
jgi:hypothetical protein